MKALKTFALVAVGLLVSVACSGGRTQKPAPTQAADSDTIDTTRTDEGRKSLIVFFSHAGDNYAVGNVKEGNTRLVADEIERLTGADMFEIVAQKDYDMPYDDLTREAKREAESGELPEYKGDVDGIEKYDTVFIGGPVWWGTYPRVMFTFFKNHDLNGKTLIPFTTHEGSGLGNVVNDLKRLYPDATVTGSFSIAGHDVRGGLDKVDEWIKGLEE